MPTPTLINGVNPRNRRLIYISLAVGTVVGIFVNIWLLPVFCLVTYVSGISRWARYFVGASAALCLFGNVIYYAIEEATHGWHALFGWVTHFQQGNSLIWIGCSLVLAFIASTNALSPNIHLPENPQLPKALQKKRD